ncbi:MAG: cytochrome c maturation protein CcmE [Gracilimonas sp.]|uniref:cytochrome c maturation protein CcmE domain-containing protein n=1 Tax=Gracilimonas TaxID=649462 RepID=UPI001B2493A1|nr:cytochrome c maturation protein CcmE [Gracilimonas sp.]MBO6586719.1 cytochrome c maturation protein CcmE [Gracilimonas sp.]MBO6615376.1 cytochrome c maturation protein CcmE [Gracilimonas sp.]
MKPKLIIGIVAIVGFTSLLMYNFGESISTYTTFEGATEMSSAHIPGTWDEEKGAEFSLETRKFVFYMKDEDGVSKKVVYSKPKPNNFEQADQLVVIGEMRGDTFYANEMLMKCPSKYNDADPSQFSEASQG